jgi:hypothetical protein
LVPEEELDDEAKFVPNSIFVYVPFFIRKCDRFSDFFASCLLNLSILVFSSGLPKDISVDQIASLFEHVGTIEKVNYVPSRRLDVLLKLKMSCLHKE